MKLYLAFIAIALSFMLSITYKIHQYKTFGTYLHASDKDCTTTLPATYKIVYSELNKDYAITVDKPYSTGKYLWCDFHGHVSTSFDPYTTFSDSCKAKSFVLNYLRKQDLENNKFKSYK